MFIHSCIAQVDAWTSWRNIRAEARFDSSGSRPTEWPRSSWRPSRRAYSTTSTCTIRSWGLLIRIYEDDLLSYNHTYIHTYITDGTFWNMHRYWNTYIHIYLMYSLIFNLSTSTSTHTYIHSCVNSSSGRTPRRARAPRAATCWPWKRHRSRTWACSSSAPRTRAERCTSRRWPSRRWV